MTWDNNRRYIRIYIYIYNTYIYKNYFMVIFSITPFFLTIHDGVFHFMICKMKERT